MLFLSSCSISKNASSSCSSENVELPVEFYGLRALVDIGHLTEYTDIIDRNRLGVNDTLRDVL